MGKKQLLLICTEPCEAIAVNDNPKPIQGFSSENISTWLDNENGDVDPKITALVESICKLLIINVEAWLINSYFSK